jgi:hypothetical protein
VALVSAPPLLYSPEQTVGRPQKSALQRFDEKEKRTRLARADQLHKLVPVWAWDNFFADPELGRRRSKKRGTCRTDKRARDVR